ncbi:uncharacterized protein LOC141908453 [Tubulanus polymorphus]|uniref:uncharacterized protein LOC141908453 n=1 Tax=Tubulanus polymorphus TaxID=672921 RepID=UPI003DA38AED
MNYVAKVLKQYKVTILALIFGLVIYLSLLRRKGVKTVYHHRVSIGALFPPPPPPSRVSTVLEGLPIPAVYYGDYATAIEYLHRRDYVTPRNCSATIPKIIHQTWKDEMIPIKFKSSVESIIANHPDFEYWMWTDALAEEFISKKFPSFLPVYKSYPKAINRADAIRYFVLYEYGGVYADLDIVSLRSLNDLLGTHTFLIPEDHPFHTHIIFGLNRIPLNAFMMSIPKHPFMKAVITHLAEYSKRKNILYTAGPMMLDLELSRYEDVLGDRKDNSLCDAVYMGKWQNFIPLFLDNAVTIAALKHKCGRKDGNPRKLKDCDFLRARNFTQLTLPDTAYTRHKFSHVHEAKTRKLMFHIADVAGESLRNVSQLLENI